MSELISEPTCEPESRAGNVLCVPVLLGAALLGANADAHHGTADYVTGEVVTLTGTVAQWRWANPHTWLYLEVPAASGEIERWSIEGGPPRPMEQQGWSSESLRAGEPVTIRMSPSRAQSGILRDVIREDGEVLVIDRPWMR